MKVTECHSECTWGDGPDVILCIQIDGKNIYYDLTADQAENLAFSLRHTSNFAKEMETVCKNFDDEARILGEGVVATEGE